MQLLEDVICLVFLEFYWFPFSQKHALEPEKASLGVFFWGKKKKVGRLDVVAWWYRCFCVLGLYRWAFEGSLKMVVLSQRCLSWIF